MNYIDGKTIRVGDTLICEAGVVGKVVFSVDTNEYSEEFAKEEWEYLKKSIMMKTKDGSLIFYEKGEFKKSNEF